MKKITIFLAAVLCVFGLTACGSEKEYSDYQQQKINDSVQVAVSEYLPYLNLYMGIEDEEVLGYALTDMMEPWDELTMEEVKEQAETVYAVNSYYSSMGQENKRISVDGYGFYNAWVSFTSAGEELGHIVTYDETKIETKVDDDQIIVTIPVVCENGKATAEIIVSNDFFCELKAASITRDFTLSEKMQKGALNTAVGIGTVFAVLIVICLLISLFGIIPKIQKSIADSKAAKEAEKNATEKSIDNAVNQIIATETVDESDDMELVAVIAAAIAAYEGSATTEGYVVRSIRRRR